MNIMTMGGHTVRAVILVLIAAAVTACHDNSGGSAAPVSVPNVVGETQSAATTAITAVGLTVGAVTQASSASIASGAVISETPAAASSVAKGSAVALVVSTGPATVSVPNVVGDTQTAATSALTGAGLSVGAVTQQSSSSVASGDVITETPAAATSVARGSAVALVVSSGPPTYTIGGTLIGLAPSATVQVLNGADSLAVSANGSFTLPTGVAGGGTYSVTVGTPTSAQTCASQNASGTIASAKVTNVVVYCTYNFTAAKLKATFTSVGAAFDDVTSGVNYPYDYVSADTFDGVSAISSTFSANFAGSLVQAQTGTETYAVTTANAIPVYTDNSPGLGGVEGVNGDAIVAAEGMVAGSPPQIYVAVLPNTSATTDSVNGNYTQVALRGHPSTGDIETDEGPITLINGSVTGMYSSNTAGTIVTGNANSGTFTISNGLVSVRSGQQQGAVSADGDLIVVADTNTGDDPNISVLLLQGTGVTQATFEGVYSVAGYGGDALTATMGNAITLFAYGNGTWSLTGTANHNGTIATNNTGSGTYTVASDGTLTMTDASGDVLNGALTADGNALVLATMTSGSTPEIYVGVRQ